MSDIVYAVVSVDANPPYGGEKGAHIIDMGWKEYAMKRYSTDPTVKILKVEMGTWGRFTVLEEIKIKGRRK